MLKKEDSSEHHELIVKLQTVSSMNAEEKELKKEIRSSQEALHLKTKDKIGNLTQQEIVSLLQTKWVKPIMDGILALPDKEIEKLQKAVETLSKKYDDTYEDIERDIKTTGRELSKMMSQLTGTEEDMAGIRELQKFLGGD